MFKVILCHTEIFKILKYSGLFWLSGKLVDYLKYQLYNKYTILNYKFKAKRVVNQKSKPDSSSGKTF